MHTKTLYKMLALVLVGMLEVSVAQAATFDVTAPDDVSNVTVEDTDTDSIELSWDTATDNVAVTGYKVYYGTTSVQVDGGYYDNEILTDSTDTEYTVEDLQSDTKYYMAVTALDANNNESYNYSIEVSATTDEILHRAADDEENEDDEERTAEPGDVEAVLTADQTNGSSPLAVQFNASESNQEDGAIASYAWDYNNDGIVDSTIPNPSYTFTESGVYEVSLIVIGTDGQTDTAEAMITVWDTEIIETTAEDTEAVEPVIAEEAEEVETVEPVQVETTDTAEDNLPETGPALLIPALIAGAGALLTNRKK